MIIGINGLKGSGKDTVGKYLEKEYGVTLASFAALLKQSAAALFGIDPERWERLKNDDGARVILERRYSEPGTPNAREVIADMSAREFLQRYGTEAHRDVFGEDFWVNALFEKLPPSYVRPYPLYAITDARFVNELAEVTRRGGVVVQVDRGLEAEDGHRSEELPDPKWIDATIPNQEGFEELYACVDEWASRVGLEKK